MAMTYGFSTTHLNRFLWSVFAAPALWCAASFGLIAPAAERPAVTQPRQTSGDKAVQPSWEERLTVTVGLKEADIVGADQRAIQAAVDYVARLGGGNVRIRAGTYRVRNAVYLQSGVNLIGDGPETILIKV